MSGYRNSGEFEREMAFWKDFFRTADTEVAVWTDEFDSFLEAEDWDIKKRITFWQYLAEAQPDCHWILNSLNDALMDHGDYEVSMKVWNQLVWKYPNYQSPGYHIVLEFF